MPACRDLRGRFLPGSPPRRARCSASWACGPSDGGGSGTRGDAREPVRASPPGPGARRPAWREVLPAGPQSGPHGEVAGEHPVLEVEVGVAARSSGGRGVAGGHPPGVSAGSMRRASSSTRSCWPRDHLLEEALDRGVHRRALSTHRPRRPSGSGAVRALPAPSSAAPPRVPARPRRGCVPFPWRRTGPCRHGRAAAPARPSLPAPATPPRRWRGTASLPTRSDSRFKARRIRSATALAARPRSIRRTEPRIPRRRSGRRVARADLAADDLAEAAQDAVARRRGPRCRSTP